MIDKLIKKIDKKNVVIGILIVALFTGSAFVVTKRRSTNNHQFVEAQKQDLKVTVEVTGKVEAEKKTELTFKVIGKVNYLPVKKGDTVSAGKMVASIDTSDLKAGLDKSLEDYMTTRWDFEQSRDDYDIGSRRLDEMGTLTDEEKRILEKSQFSLNKLVKDVEIAFRGKKDAALYAPFGGVVTKVDVEIGNLSSALKPAVVIQKLDNLKITADISETEIGEVRLGHPVSFTLDAFPDKTLIGKVVEIDPAETVISGIVYYPTTIIPDNLPEGTKPGMTADITIQTLTKENVLIIPYHTLSEISDNKAIVKVLEGENIVEREVELGVKGDGGVVEITAGLEEWEKVIVSSES